MPNPYVEIRVGPRFSRSQLISVQPPSNWPYFVCSLTDWASDISGHLGRYEPKDPPKSGSVYVQAEIEEALDDFLGCVNALAPVPFRNARVMYKRGNFVYSSVIRPNSPVWVPPGKGYGGSYTLLFDSGAGYIPLEQQIDTPQGPIVVPIDISIEQP